MFVNRSSNVFWIVAVSTSVPDTNATPRITAIAVSTKRILLAANPLRVTFHIGAQRYRSGGPDAGAAPERDTDASVTGSVNPLS